MTLIRDYFEFGRLILYVVGIVQSNKSLNPSCFARPCATETVAHKLGRFCWAIRTSFHGLNGTLIDNRINQAVLNGLTGRHEKVATRVLLNTVKWLTGAIRQFLVQPFLEIKNFFRLNFDINGLTLRPAKGLVDHDSRIRQS